MKVTLTFSEIINYQDSTVGITIPVVLGHRGNFVQEQAKVDPGAEVCLFRYEVGSRLGIPIE